LDFVSHKMYFYYLQSWIFEQSKNDCVDITMPGNRSFLHKLTKNSVILYF
jgi:hypothetical protein